MVVGFTTTCEIESRLWRGVLDTTLCGKVFQSGLLFVPGTPVSSTNDTDRHDITEISHFSPSSKL